MYFNLCLQESSSKRSESWRVFWSRIYCLIIAGWASFEILNEYNPYAWIGTVERTAG